jgi:hypothetical protein
MLKGRPPNSCRVKDRRPGVRQRVVPAGRLPALLDWHLQWYTENDPERWIKGNDPALVQVTGGYRLTTQKKKEILVNCIHGVDIDAQAVEVTKLSLLLKVLEEKADS